MIIWKSKILFRILYISPGELHGCWMRIRIRKGGGNFKKLGSEMFFEGVVIGVIDKGWCICSLNKNKNGIFRKSPLWFWRWRKPLVQQLNPLLVRLDGPQRCAAGTASEHNQNSSRSTANKTPRWTWAHFSVVRRLKLKGGKCQEFRGGQEVMDWMTRKYASEIRSRKKKHLPGQGGKKKLKTIRQKIRRNTASLQYIDLSVRTNSMP